MPVATKTGGVREMILTDTIRFHYDYPAFPRSDFFVGYGPSLLINFRRCLGMQSNEMRVSRMEVI
jgi:hypothetical protein